MKTVNVLEYTLSFNITPQSEGGFLASCPIWPDCYAQGETIDEAVLEVMAVAQSLIELYREEDLPIPLEEVTEKVLETLDSPLLTIPILVSA